MMAQCNVTHVTRTSSLVPAQCFKAARVRAFFGAGVVSDVPLSPGPLCYPHGGLVLLCYKSRFLLIDFPGSQEQRWLTWPHEASAAALPRSVAAIRRLSGAVDALCRTRRSHRSDGELHRT